VAKNHLTSAESYELFIYTIQQHYPQIKVSTLVPVRSGKLFGELSGQLFFEGDVRLFAR
jgi:hypothetical protein